MQGPNRLHNNSSKFFFQFKYYCLCKCQQVRQIRQVRRVRRVRQVRRVTQVNKYIREIIQCAKNNPVEQKKSQTKTILINNIPKMLFLPFQFTSTSQFKPFLFAE